MGEQGLSSPKKKILYIGLFIVPFLVAMALIFFAKGLGTLPIMDENGEFVQMKYKNPPPYYIVPEFTLTGFDSSRVEFSHKDSVIYLVTLLPHSKADIWEEHILYVGEKVIPRATNVKVISVFENDFEMKVWRESPQAYIHSKSDKWFAAHATPQEFQDLLSRFKTEINDSLGIPPYILVDKEEQIRAFCLINDAKISRDIPKMFKILSNQYVPRKLDIKQVKN